MLRHRGVDPFRYAFDVLWLDGDDLRGLTLIEPQFPYAELATFTGFVRLRIYGQYLPVGLPVTL